MVTENETAYKLGYAAAIADNDSLSFTPNPYRNISAEYTNERLWHKGYIVGNQDYDESNGVIQDKANDQ